MTSDDSVADQTAATIAKDNRRQKNCQNTKQELHLEFLSDHNEKGRRRWSNLSARFYKRHVFLSWPFYRQLKRWECHHWAKRRQMRQRFAIQGLVCRPAQWFLIKFTFSSGLSKKEPQQLTTPSERNNSIFEHSNASLFSSPLRCTHAILADLCSITVCMFNRLVLAKTLPT